MSGCKNSIGMKHHNIVAENQTTQKEERRETEAWMLLGEEALEEVWSDPDEDVWNVYSTKEYQ